VTVSSGAADSASAVSYSTRMNDELAAKLPSRAAYLFGASHGLEREMEEIRGMPIEWPAGTLKYGTSLRCGYIIDLFEKHGIFEDFKATHWPNGNTQEGQGRRRFYLGVKERYEQYSAEGDRDVLLEATENGDEVDEDQAFAAERDLRDFLAKNPSCIESGLKIYDADNRCGVEYAIEGGYIDLLAVDREQRFVVIELKVGRGRNKAIGQLLYYMGWVDQNLGAGRCRGMIIAKDIPADLLLAVQRVPEVSVHRYSLSVTVERVSPKP
jgi:hypothetical protein